MRTGFSFISIALAGALLVSVATSVTVKAQAIPTTDEAGDPTPTDDEMAPDQDPVVGSGSGEEEPLVVDDIDIFLMLTSGAPPEQMDLDVKSAAPANQAARNENQSSHDNYRTTRHPRSNSCLLKAFKISKTC